MFDDTLHINHDNSSTAYLMLLGIRNNKNQTNDALKDK